jgi:hypothetical protein
VGEKRNALRVLMEKLEGKRRLTRLRLRWENNIKTDIKEIGWEGVQLDSVAQSRERWWAVVNTEIHLQVP